MTLLFRMLAFFVVGCCSLQICAAVKTKVDSNLILESVELDASGYQIEVASDSLVSQPSSKNKTLATLPTAAVAKSDVPLAAELAESEVAGEVLSSRKHARRQSSSRKPAVRSWEPPRIIPGELLPLPEQVPTDIRTRVRTILEHYGKGHTTIRLFDFDTTLFPTDDYYRLRDYGIRPTVNRQAMYEGSDRLAFRDDGLLFTQPGIPVIVTNGARGWIESCMKQMPLFSEKVASGRLIVIATRDFLGHQRWANLNINKLNVFPFVLGAFALEGVRFDTLYSYGDGVLDMKAGEYTSRYYDFQPPSKAQKFIGVRFTEEASTAELLAELEYLIRNPPENHIEFLPAGGNEVGSILAGEPEHEIKFAVQIRTATVNGETNDDICHGWHEELTFYAREGRGQRWAAQDYYDLVA